MQIRINVANHFNKKCKNFLHRIIFFYNFTYYQTLQGVER